MVEQELRQVVQRIVADAPAGWTGAVMNSTAGWGGVSVSGGYSVPGTPMRGGRLPNPFKELMALAQALKEARGWTQSSLEISCKPSGQYRLDAVASTFKSLRGWLGGFQAVLDPDYRLPQPGLEQPEGPAGPAGDPDLAVARFDQYMARRAAILGRPEQLPPPASPAALDEAERRLGRPLPADLRALYAIANGDGVGYKHRYLIEGYGWMPLEGLVAVQAEHCGPDWPGWDLGWDWVIFDADPRDTVRRCNGHPAWLPFATGEDGNYLAVDLSPGRNGNPGQIIYMGRDYHHGPAYVADSITSLLGHHLRLLEQGAYTVEGEYIALQDTTGSSRRSAVVEEIPDVVPPALQEIHINDAASPVDLTPLPAAAHLRRLHLNRCATADLATISALPIESLRVTLEGCDLAALDGHRHLRSLDLETNAPIDIAPLCTVPHLRGLDLSRAEVKDLSVLGSLDDLRYLALTASQWNRLLDEGTAPPALAAARLADRDASLDQALAWAARLGLDTADAIRVTGTLRTENP